MYNNLMGGRHSFVCAYHPAAPGSNPNHTIYAFFNMYYWNCIEKITRINKKRPGLAHFLSMYNKSIYISIPMIAVSLISLPWIDPRQVRSKSCRNSDSLVPEKLSNRQLVSVVVVVIVVVVVAVSAVVDTARVLLLLLLADWFVAFLPKSWTLFQGHRSYNNFRNLERNLLWPVDNFINVLRS